MSKAISTGKHYVALLQKPKRNPLRKFQKEIYFQGTVLKMLRGQLPAYYEPMYHY